jgi:predicted CXXCH cytochrome family protein
MILLVPAVSFAAGAHDGLNCTGCHGIHDAKGDVIFAVEPNVTAMNPRTNAPYEGATALCLGCHADMNDGGMGILPVSSAMSHPYGVQPNPKVATVPGVFLRNGKLECVGCHDPHPSNPNYKYLRVDTEGGGNMQVFCAMCHSSKSEMKPAAAGIFDSMDERMAEPAQ